MKIISESEANVVTKPTSSAARSKSSTGKKNKKKNKSNSELTRNIRSSAKKDLTYYYSLTNVKYLMDDDEDTNSNERRFSSSSLSSISSSSNGATADPATADNQLSGSASSSSEPVTSSSDEDDIILEESPREDHDDDDEDDVDDRIVQPVYRLQKSITLPNANEMAQFANCQTMGGYIKARTSSSMLDETSSFARSSCQEPSGLSGAPETGDAVDNDGLMAHTECSEAGCCGLNFSEQAQFDFPISVHVANANVVPVSNVTNANTPVRPNRPLSHNHKSLSDYCVTSSRYILSRYRRRYRNYRQHGVNRCRSSKLSKSMSVNRRG